MGRTASKTPAKKSDDKDAAAEITPPVSPKKKVSKFARKPKAFIPTTGTNGHYVFAAELRQGIFVTWLSQLRNGKYVEPFSKDWKDAVEKGLSDKNQKITTIEGKMVHELGIIMLCCRRGPNGTELHQSDKKKYPWMQCVHIIPPELEGEDILKWRSDIHDKTKKFVQKVDDEKSTWGSRYERGRDLTERDLIQRVDSRLRDEDIAKLIFGLYDIKTQEHVDAFIKDELVDDFFTSKTAAKKALNNHLKGSV